jgi:hypothetical protein
MDYYIPVLTTRLLENGGRYQAHYLIPMNFPGLTPDTVDVIFYTYKTCSYFCLNIFSVVLCNMSVNQQSFLKSNYLVSITTNIDDSLAF